MEVIEDSQSLFPKYDPSFKMPIAQFWKEAEVGDDDYNPYDDDRVVEK